MSIGAKEAPIMRGLLALLPDKMRGFLLCNDVPA
jgi:hypothetical protein